MGNHYLKVEPEAPEMGPTSPHLNVVTLEQVGINKSSAASVMGIKP
jgi:hypothetical protein